MKIKIAKQINEKETLILPFFTEQLKKFPFKPSADLFSFISKIISKKKFEAGRKETFTAYFNDHTVILLGMGKEKNFLPRHARELGAAASKSLSSAKVGTANIFFPEALIKNSEEFFEGLLLSQYQFKKYKTPNKKNTQIPIESLTIIPQKNSTSIISDFQKAEEISSAIVYIRDLVNSPSNEVDSLYLAAEAEKIAKANKYKITVLNKKELERQKWGGLLAVNLGSAKEARAVILSYQGAKNKKDAPYVFVGKGITFDTGGYSLKPSSSMDTMHLDMAGAATVLGIFSLLKKLSIKKNVIGIIPTTDNMVNHSAYKPSDIIRMLSGKTVEVVNTDAEGRLVLADGITYANKFKPKNIITIATLTGAVSVALGDRYTGLLGNDTKLKQTLKKAGDEVDDLCWPLPIHPDYRKRYDSDVADLRNHDKNSAAGTIMAAIFLEKFVGKNKWAHLDIAGTAFNNTPKAYETKGATGSALRMLLRFLENEK